MSTKIKEKKLEQKTFCSKICKKKGLQKPPLDEDEREECVQKINDLHPL